MKNYLLAAIILTSSFVYSQTGTTIIDSFASGGVMRHFTYYVPAKYHTANIAVPLIYNIHGWTGSSAKQENFEDFRLIADTANFIIIHPQALLASGPFGLQPSWNTSETFGPTAGDKVFLMNLLDTIETRYKIKTDRVYSTGFSQGGFMSYDFACFYSTRFAAIASVSAGMSNVHASACTPQHPMPVMEIHGTKDQLAAYTGSAGSLSVDSVIRYWIHFNGCDTTPASVTNLPDISTSDSSNVIHYVYTGGAQGSTVELYKIINGGHQVPSDTATSIVYGLGNRNMDFRATKEIWRFFSKYKLAVGIDEQAANSSAILIYPNPSNGIFRVDVKNNQNVIITIVNVLGETVLEKKISDASVILDLSNVPAGVYFYQAVNKTGIIQSGKLLVQ